MHIAEVRQHFRGRLATTGSHVRKYGIDPIGTLGCGWEPFGNSGAGCVALAAVAGARRAIMLGYDCQKTNGLTHWHGSHPRGLGDAGSMPKWPGQFERLKSKWGGTLDIVNCSRQTALKSFRRGVLEEELTKGNA